MKLLPWVGLAGLLYFFLKPEEVEAAAPPPGNDVDAPVSKAPFLEGKTIGIQPIANPCFSRVKRNYDNEDLIMAG